MCKDFDPVLHLGFNFVVTVLTLSKLIVKVYYMPRNYCITFFRNFGALLDSSYGYSGSSLLTYHPIWNPTEYIENDYLFRENCCFDSNICQVYTRLRPADSCSTYRAPRRGILYLKTLHVYIAFINCIHI